uniref:hypothetical protein n=1 Tax=Methylobacterium sp. sgz302541 TaxID=3418177 RepID=UPI003D3288AB
MVRPKEREAEIFFGDLRSVAGQDAVNRLIEACGGTVVYIPRNGCRDEASPLAQAWSGLDAANAIIQKLNSVGRYGIKINIPLRHMSTYSVVGEKIRADILSGAFSVADIAARFGVTQ